MPLLVGGIAASVLATRKRSVQRCLETARRSRAALAFERARRLSQAVVGNDKQAISRVLGRPQSTVGSSSVNQYFAADTWYYPLDSANCIALAVVFEDDIAREASVLHPGT